MKQLAVSLMAFVVWLVSEGAAHPQAPQVWRDGTPLGAKRPAYGINYPILGIQNLDCRELLRLIGVERELARATRVSCFLCSQSGEHLAANEAAQRFEAEFIRRKCKEKNPGSP